MKQSEVVSDVHFTVTITHSMSLSQWIAVWPEVLAVAVGGGGLTAERTTSRADIT